MAYMLGSLTAVVLMQSVKAHDWGAVVSLVAFFLCGMVDIYQRGRRA
jgi:hypothetical protein